MTENPARLRVFFALWPDHALQEALYQLGSSLQSVCLGLPMRAEMIHLTLAFLGALPVDRLDALYATAARVHSPAFDLKIDQLSYWRHPQILWAGSQQPPVDLTNLAGRLHTELNEAGFAFDNRRPFSPHFSLLRKASCNAFIQLPIPLNMQVSEFVLVLSEITARGASYRVMRRWSLM
ncbi:MAG: RNA 2',3'-cyclic phosphodiesterase [Sulfuriferula sp.]